MDPKEIYTILAQLWAKQNGCTVTKVTVKE